MKKLCWWKIITLPIFSSSVISSSFLRRNVHLPSWSWSHLSLMDWNKCWFLTKHPSVSGKPSDLFSNSQMVRASVGLNWPASPKSAPPSSEPTAPPAFKIVWISYLLRWLITSKAHFINLLLYVYIFSTFIFSTIISTSFILKFNFLF